MTCETALELISQSLDGTLSPAEEAALQAHLRDCPTCRALQTELMGLHEAWGELEVVPPQELKERVLSALPAQRPSKALYWKRWGAMAAALALVALAAWRLPSFLYQGDAPQDKASVTSADTGMPENAEVPALGVLSDEATSADEALPDYVDGLGVDVNSYVTAPQSADAPVPFPTVYDVEAKLSSDVTDLSAETPVAKRADKELFEQESAAEVHTTAGDAPFSGVIAGAGGGGDEAGAVVFPSARMAPAPDGDAVAVDNSYDMVPESAPTMSAKEWADTAEPLEPVTEALDPFGVYCGVLTLEDYVPQGPYPSRTQENGETWYALPAGEFAALVEEMDAQALPYELLSAGDNIDPDAPEGLVISRPSNIP